MIIRTVKQAGEFAILPKAMLNSDNLSWEARGLLGYLLEKPDGWQISLTNLVRNGPAKADKVRRILSELEDAGYLVRRRTNGDGGAFKGDSEIYETPQPVVPPYAENPYMVTSPCAGLPSMVEPSMVKPSMGEPSMVNRHIYQEQESAITTLAIPNQNQEQQQQHASPAEAEPGSGIAAAAVSLTSEQRAALALLGVAAPAFTAPETFVRRYDPRLIGYWCIAVDSMTGSELEAIKSIPAFLYAMVKKGDWPALSGRQEDFWKGLLANRQRDDEPEELEY